MSYHYSNGVKYYFNNTNTIRSFNIYLKDSKEFK